VLWNGLKHTRLAYVTRATFTAGSTDRIIVLYATDDQLLAAALPFSPQLYDTPRFGWQDNPAVGGLFAQAVEQAYPVRPFVLADQSSEYSARRQAVIEAVLAGQPVQAVADEAPQQQAPDLMALLTASVEAQREKVAA
jgi:hypothetical protein